jgi:hypothetical protein
MAPDSEKGLRWGFTVSSVQDQVAVHRRQAVVADTIHVVLGFRGGDNLS